MKCSSTLILCLLLLAVRLQGRFAPDETSARPTAQQPMAKLSPEDPFGRNTPRGCVMGFLKAAERGDYKQAAQYLDIPPNTAEGPELARQLETVLNAALKGNIEVLSRSPRGNVRDALRSNRDLLGAIDSQSGRVNVLLDRIQRDNSPPVWLFSSETLNRVPELFKEIKPPIVERIFPQAFARIAVFSIPLWRWIVILLSGTIAVFSASFIASALVPVLRPVVRRLTGHQDDTVLFLLRRPLRLIMLALAFRGLGELALSLLAHQLWDVAAGVLGIVGCGWLLIQFSDILSELRSRQLVRTQRTSQLAVLGLTHRFFKILVLFVAVMWLLHGAGINVSAMLAGLGIGGIALALAAQKTLEDLFGGIVLISREAIRVGDFCRLADQMGTVEDIGLSSTRVRTLDDTIVTIPNAKISQLNLENFSMRRKIWFHHIFGVPYETSLEQSREMLDKITDMLRTESRVEQESARIRMIGLGTSSLTLEIFAYVLETDYGVFLEVQERLLLKVLTIVGECGVRIALPCQTTYILSRADSHRNPEHMSASH